MAGNHSLRGSGLGSYSLEDEKGVEFAARQNIGFVCPEGHEFAIAFSIEAELPVEWECPRCGSVCSRADGTAPAPKEEKIMRSHWDMLMERRSLDELKALLDERLAEIRSDNF